MRIIIKSIMFISSYFPLYVFLIILQWNVFQELFFSPGSFSWEKLIFIVCIIFFSLISGLSLILIKHSGAINYLKIGKIKRATDDVISYIFTYIIPILSFSFDNQPMLIINFFLFIMIWFLYIKLNLIYLNPLWSICGYVSYEYDDFGYIISNMSIDDIKRMKGKNVAGYYLTNGIFVIPKKYNRI